jgi:DeoR family transcriptional regulator, fructose operon transcriptional repressor
MRRNTLALVGPLASNALTGLHVDKLFLATNGMDIKQGLTSPNLIEAQTKKAMIASAREVILVADHSKVGRIAFTQVCRMDRVHRVITDAGAPPEFIQSLEKLHINVLIAGKPLRRPSTPTGLRGSRTDTAPPESKSQSE